MCSSVERPLLGVTVENASNIADWVIVGNRLIETE